MDDTAGRTALMKQCYAITTAINLGHATSVCDDD